MTTATVTRLRTAKSDVFADPDDIRDFMSQVSDEYLECRMTMHSWDRTTDHVDDKAGIFEQEYQCIHCGQRSLVPRSLSTGIQIAPRKPIYDKEYLAPKGMGRMNSAEGKGLAFLELRARAEQKAKVRRAAAKKAAATRKKARKRVS